MPFDAHPYGRVAFCYDELAALYSRGRIGASKRAFLAWIEPGERLLFVGVGRGEDALEAARRGADVTAVDLSRAMLDRVAARAEREGLALRLVEGDAAKEPASERFDRVIAHYFLNLYTAADAERMLAILVARVGPGGALHLADFAPAAGGRGARWLTALYYRPVVLAGWLTGLSAWHPIPDYPGMLSRVGFAATRTRRYPVGPAWGPAYWALEARRRTSA